MDKYQQFKSLHFSNEVLFLGNAYDVLSAMILENAGFKAIGTTSWGVANTFGYNDGEHIRFNDYLIAIKKMIEHVNIPVSVDIESGYGNNTPTILKNVLAVADCGAVGINIEDSLKDGSNKLRDINEHCELLSQLRIELDKKGLKDFFINARTDTYLKQFSNPLDETLKRGQSYAKHGADGLFVPGLTNENDIKTITQNIKLPLNVMSLPQFTDLKKLSPLGIKRFSFGNALSDLVIANLEQVTKAVIQNNNTAILYEHAPVELKLKELS